MMSLYRVLFFTIIMWLPIFVFAEPLDINTADAETISKIMKGIGEKKAKAIVEYRNQHGPFQSIDEIVNVKGVALKTIEKNRDVITVLK